MKFPVDLDEIRVDMEVLYSSCGAHTEQFILTDLMGTATQIGKSEHLQAVEAQDACPDLLLRRCQGD